MALSGTVVTVPVWDAPHAFVRRERDQTTSPIEFRGVEIPGVPVAPFQLPDVFSYGLLMADVRLVLDDAGRKRMAPRWGATPTEQLRSNLAVDDVVRPENQPWSVVNADMLGLASFVAALERAADEQERVPLGFEDQMRTFLDRVRRPDVFVWVWRRESDGWTRVRVARYESLLQRLAVEFDELVSARPRLSRCTLCGRVFVPLRPARPEQHCRANLWSLGYPPHHLERCAPLDDTERLRTKKRLAQRHRRTLERHRDPRHPEVVAALRALGNWERDNPPARRGRQERPMPGNLDQRPPIEGEQDG